MNTLRLALVGLAVMAWFLPAPVEARIYKCVDKDGEVSYSNNPCPENEKTSKVLKPNSGRELFDCTVVSAFSTEVALRMKRGQSADSVVQHYGGERFLTKVSEAVIDYVYTHEVDKNIAVNRIATLSTNRCESGLYSSATQCEYFPPKFITEMGGCEAITGQRAVAAGELRTYASEYNRGSANGSSEPSMSGARPKLQVKKRSTYTPPPKNPHELAPTDDKDKQACRDKHSKEWYKLKSQEEDYFSAEDDERLRRLQSLAMDKVNAC